MSANNIRLYLTGKKPRPYDPSNNSITINAAGNNIQANTVNSCFITPIRQQSQGNALYYNNTTGEIAYDLSGGSGGGGESSTSNSLWDLSGTNFYGPSGASMNTTNMADKHYNIACGRLALDEFTDGSHNIAIGSRASEFGAVKNNTINIGRLAGRIDSLSDDIFIGFYAGATNAGYGTTIGLGVGAANSGGSYSIAVGIYSGYNPQLLKSVAVGSESMQGGRAYNSVAAGCDAGGKWVSFLHGDFNYVALGYRALYNLGLGADASGNIAIGYEALRYLDNVSNFNIAIGYKASETVVDASNTIVINATGATMDPQDSSRCYIKPIRNVINQEGIPLHYDSTSGQIAYGLGPSGNLWNLDANKNFYGPSGESFQGSGINNVVCGKDALPEGNNNVAVGYEAMLRGVGENSVAVGHEAGKGSTGGLGLNRCVAVGYEALRDASDASGCIAVGYEALGEHTLGQRNIAIGYLAMNDSASTARNDNIAIGYESYWRSGYYVGSANIAIGMYSGGASSANLLECDGNIGIGYQACRFSGKGNVGFGYKAGYGGAADPLLRSFNINIGYSAGATAWPSTVNDVSNSILLSAANTDVFATVPTRLNNSFYCRPGSSGIIQGTTTSKLLYDPSSGEITYDTHVPTGTSLWDLSGGNFWGPAGESLNLSTTGINNVAMGRLALDGISSGNSNVAVGAIAGYSLNDTSSNVCIGYYAGQSVTGSTRGGNVIVGHYAAPVMGSVTGNVAVGYYALRHNTGYLGDFNIAIGYYASYYIPTLDVDNTIVINATGEALVPQDSSRCYIKPIRQDASYNSIQSLHYDPTSGEVTYDLNYIPSAVAAMGRVGALVVDGWPWEGYWLWWGKQLTTKKAQLMYYYYRGTPYPSVYTSYYPPPKSEIIGGFQVNFDIAVSGGILGLSGGVAEEAGYTTSFSSSVILGFTLSDAGFGQLSHMVLCEVEYTNAGPPPPILVVTISNKLGVTLAPWNMNTPPTYGAFLDSSGSKGMMWINQVQDASGWGEVEPMGFGRQALACAALGGKLYALGGFYSGTALRTVEVYDPIENSWNDVAPMDTSRQRLGCAALGGKIYAMGGYDNPGGGGVVFGSVEVYDPIENSWNDVAPMDTARQWLGCAALGGKLYAVGGHDGANYLDTAEVYDPIENSWNDVASMQTSRQGVGCAALGGKLYAVGGKSISIAFLDTVEVYDPIENSWTTLDASLNTARGWFGCAALGGKLYAIGGRSPTVVATVEVYDPQDPSGGWTILDDSLNTAREYLGGAALGGKIYAVGGYPVSVPAALAEVYDPSLNPQLQVTYQGEDFYVSHQRGGPKTFIIQHPEDPDRLLRHACIEAPTRGTNLYEYQIQTATDNATTEIALPSYFSKLNGRPRVYVVPVDVFSRCAGKINEESTIALIHTEKAGTFNVIVTGIRKDPAALEFSSTEMIDF